MDLLVGSTVPFLQRLAVPAVCLLVAFLAYTPQWLFANAPDLAPGPLTTTETYTFNSLVLCLWYSYYKACTVDPGRYIFPSSITKKKKADKSDPDEASVRGGARGRTKGWCKKCAAPKPPRAHHCKVCRRCIPKMDHHCPWTSNCVSLQTFPHFLRFLLYTNFSLWTLLYLLLQRFHGLWEFRHLPAYLGPTPSQLALLTVLTLVAGMTSLALGLMLMVTVKSWLFNTTVIESWEIERHESALERRPASSDQSWWSANERAPGGDRDAAHLALEPVEFPYDIGIFANMAAAMGTRNPLLWLLPFADGPLIRNTDADADGDGAMTGPGWTYEENGLNDREGMWPPPNPDKIRHEEVWRERQQEADQAARYGSAGGSFARDEQEAFRRRQERDLQRWEASRSRIMGELEEIPPTHSQSHPGNYGNYDFVNAAYAYERSRDPDRKPGSRIGSGPRPRPRTSATVDEDKSGWVNADGEHLGDYGVDEDAESDASSHYQIHEHEDEDVPLAELIRRRKVRTKDGEDT
ncbi:zf-DHHC-domain-containing protein [Hypoxylon sp. NC1633]|nr:zf-DHHC-domain-containing protein [Hypoxylon sp. NC1633]